MVVFSHQHEVLKPYLPYNIDHGTEAEHPLFNNLFYLSVWAVAHSTFARDSVKVYVTKIIPEHLERPLYVFQSSYLLHNGKNSVNNFYCSIKQDFSYQKLVTYGWSIVRNPWWFQELCCRILHFWLAFSRNLFPP